MKHKVVGTKLNDGVTRYMAKEVAELLGIKPSAFSTYVHNKVIGDIDNHIKKVGRRTYYDRYAITLICRERKVKVPEIVEMNSEKDLEDLTTAFDYHFLGLSDKDFENIGAEIAATNKADALQQLHLYMKERELLAEKIKKLKDENYFLKLKIREQQELMKEYRIRFFRAMHISEQITKALAGLLKKWGAKDLKPQKEIVDEYFRGGLPELFETEAMFTSMTINEFLKRTKTNRKT